MAWAGLGCLNVFINSIVWNGTVANLAPVWCDICLLHFVLSVSPRSLICVGNSQPLYNWHCRRYTGIVTRDQPSLVQDRVENGSDIDEI
jgi:hypothetical protein